MNPELKTKHGVLSLEGETYSMDVIVESTRSLLVSYINDIRSFIDNTFSTGHEQATTFGFVKNHALERSIKKTNHSSIMMLSTYVPPGMMVDWLKYLDALEECQRSVDNIIVDVLKPAKEYFSLALGSPERLKERSPASDISKIKTHEKEIAAAKKSLQLCYSENVVETKKPFGDVFKRSADWTTANNALQQLTERLARVPAKDVLEYVNDISDVLDRLALRLNQSPDVYEISGLTTKIIADLCMRMAQEVEFYAAHCFIMKTATSAMSDTNAQLQDILKNG